MTEPFAISIGSVLAGKYRVDGVLGRGGMATVVEATHLQLGEAVAIKILHREVLGRHGAILRFLREARVAMRLRSEHVARVFDVATMEDGTPFIVMELLEGSDFGSLIAARGALPVSEAVDLVLQACQAIAEAHAAGVVHRDLKPANLFLCARVDGTPLAKVLDFGVSKVPREDSWAGDPLAQTAPPSGSFAVEESREPTSDHDATPTTVTLTHALLGSPRYMAPEQLRSARDVDRRADVWALGVILQELVTGRPPFGGDTLATLRGHILEDCPAALRTPQGAHPALEAALARCFAKDPAARYADVRALAEALVGFGSADARASFERIVRMSEARRREVAPASGPARARRATGRVLVWSGVGAAVVACALAAPRIGALPRAGEPEAAREAAPEAPRETAHEAPRAPVRDALLASPASTPLTHAVVAIPAPTPLPVASAPRHAAPSKARARAIAPQAAQSAPAAAPADPLGLDTGSLFTDRR